MIQLFHGHDSFESYQNAQKYIAKIADELNIQAKTINADEIYDPKEFIQEVEGIGLFSQDSIIFAKRLMKNKKLIELLTENFDYFYKFNIVLWEDSKADSRLSFIKKLTSKGSVLNYELPDDIKLKDWLKTELKTRQINLATNQLDYIFLHLEKNKWQYHNELNKIQLYLTHLKRDKIEEAELESLLGYDVKGDIWKFLEYFSNRNKIKAIKEFTKLTSFENNSQYIIAMIARELDILAKIKIAQDRGQDLKMLDIHPFVVNKAKVNTKNFTLQQLKLFVEKLFKLDLSIKSGEIEENLGLAMYLLLL